MKNLKHINKIVKITKQKINQNMIEKPNVITWATPKEERIVKTTWKNNIKKNK